MPSAIDATETEITLDRPPRRIISMVPSFTELVCALRLESRLIGVTRFCTDPPEVVGPLRKLGGTKNPKTDQIIELQPDLVLANREENREEDVEALREAGLNVYVGDVRSVHGSRDEIERIAGLLGGIALKLVNELNESIEEQEHLQRLRPRVRVACLIWRNPYMAVGGETYMGDLLRFCGGENVFESHRGDGRYPRLTLPDLIAADPEVILLPGEPYRFRERHRAELLALHGMSAARAGHIYLCDGQAQTWWGVRTAAGIRQTAELLDRARGDWRNEEVMPELPPGLQLEITQQDTVE